MKKILSKIQQIKRINMYNKKFIEWLIDIFKIKSNFLKKSLFIIIIWIIDDINNIFFEFLYDLLDLNACKSS